MTRCLRLFVLALAVPASRGTPSDPADEKLINLTTPNPGPATQTEASVLRKSRTTDDTKYEAAGEDRGLVTLLAQLMYGSTRFKSILASRPMKNPFLEPVKPGRATWLKEWIATMLPTVSKKLRAVKEALNDIRKRKVVVSLVARNMPFAEVFKLGITYNDLSRILGMEMTHRVPEDIKLKQVFENYLARCKKWLGKKQKEIKNTKRTKKKKKNSQSHR
uniref:RxLR effector candidate protein n=1 Tax=Hyaloperonospora arabidopsidis (strain Emoy2) TaxID=559515 RepID=M4B7R5_HYAAE|nr:RxLR effector candidate protein [Hyaloperonospora arabidopsidis Emoy2]